MQRNGAVAVVKCDFAALGSPFSGGMRGFGTIGCGSPRFYNERQTRMVRAGEAGKLR